MIWAPCLAASWACFSCFWIIDSLSPVQLAWRSAPFTLRGISTLTRGCSQSERGERVHPWPCGGGSRATLPLGRFVALQGDCQPPALARRRVTPLPGPTLRLVTAHAPAL